MRAAVYLRISDDGEGRRLGGDHQRATCLALARRLGLDVVEVYADDGCGSARVRPAYRRLLADAAARRFGTVIAYASGRLAVHPGDYEDLIELARRHGTRFVYVLSASSDGLPADPPLVAALAALAALRRLAADVAPDLATLAAEAAPAVEPLADGVTGFVRNALPGIRALVGRSAPVAGELGRSLPALGSALGVLLGRAAPAAPGVVALAGDLAAVAARPARYSGDALRHAARAYLAGRSAIRDLATALGGTADLASAAIDRAARTVTTGVRGGPAPTAELRPAVVAVAEDRPAIAGPAVGAAAAPGSPDAVDVERLAVERLAAELHEALDRYRRQYA